MVRGTRRAAPRGRGDGEVRLRTTPLRAAEGNSGRASRGCATMPRRMEWPPSSLSLFVILGGAELFTNGVEWIGEGFGLSEGAVGSVLAAVGTALPETILPLVAIVSGQASGEEIGIGAILGAPFMLTTLAMFVVGLAVLVFARGGRRSTDLDGDQGVLRQDLGYFLVMYTLALLAGLDPRRPLHWALAVVLIVGYGFYVRRHFDSPGEDEPRGEAESEIQPLYVWSWVRRVRRSLPAWSRRLAELAELRAGRASRSLLIVGGGEAVRLRASTTWPTPSTCRISCSRCWSRPSRPSSPRSSTA